MNSGRQILWWKRFWHEPVRAERLACFRIFLVLALITDQLIEFLPLLSLLFGPEGYAPEGLYDEYTLGLWRWTILFFNTDDMRIIYGVFWVHMALCVSLLVGWRTRLMSVLVYFVTLCLMNRNLQVRNYGDDVLMVGLLYLMFSPSGRAFAVDSWLKRRRAGKESVVDPPTTPTTPAWPVRIIQIQLCVIYFVTGIAKLGGSELFGSTWWRGESLHYVLNDTTLSRWSYAQLPLPLWFTAIGTYVSVAWEVLFTPLVMIRWTRKWALWFGVFFHIAIWATIDVGWFSFYTMALYGVWISDDFWRRVRKGNGGPEAPASSVDAETPAEVTA